MEVTSIFLLVIGLVIIGYAVFWSFKFKALFDVIVNAATLMLDGLRLIFKFINKGD